MKKLVAVLFFILHIFIASYGAITQKQTQTDVSILNFEESKICTTEECKKSAQRILYYMDDGEKPCNNFYKFACGKFLNETVLSEENTHVDLFTIVGDEIQNQLKNIIEEESNSTDPKAFRLVKDLYWSCMNETRIEQLGLEPLQQMLEKLGGWPVLHGDNWIESNFNWAEFAKWFQEAGWTYDFLFTFEILQDYKNNSRHIIYLGQPSTIFKWRFTDYSNITDLRKKYTALNAYFSFMLDTAELLGGDKEKTLNDLEKSLEFEIKLHNITVPKDELGNSTDLYNLMTVCDLEKKFPSIPWLEYINTILKISPEVTRDEPIVVKVPSFFNKLEDLLKKTPKRIQVNYLMWRIVANSIRYLDHEIRKKNFDYSKSLNRWIKREPRWKECVKTVTSNLDVGVSALYVRKYFKKESNKNLFEMVHNIQQEFNKKLKEINWMDVETRKAALEKIDLIEMHIAHPDELLNDTKLEEYYKNLYINPAFYFESWLNISNFKTKNQFLNFRKPFNKSDWISHSNSVDANAQAVYVKNSIRIPAGILQHMFFNNERPNYLNYGVIGHVIGHELTHHFDDLGSNYDKNGNLVDWWQPDSKDKYHNLIKCIVDQYDNYTAEEVDMKVNGKLTQNENIADNGGIKVAYQAYNKWASQHGPEPRLPGLEKYNPRQMFWISIANAWCTKADPNYLRLVIERDLHSPGEFRILGSMSNIPEFSKDFNCEVDSMMNPKNKCTVW